MGGRRDCRGLPWSAQDIVGRKVISVPCLLEDLIPTDPGRRIRKRAPRDQVYVQEKSGEDESTVVSMSPVMVRGEVPKRQFDHGLDSHVRKVCGTLSDRWPTKEYVHDTYSFSSSDPISHPSSEVRFIDMNLIFPLMIHESL